MWFFDLFKPGSVALTILTISLIAALGLALGMVRIRRISLGIGGVLFAGLFVGHFLPRLYQAASGASAELLSHQTIEFARDFGLILFVYTIGVQVGPGFLASLRREGLPLNIMAGAIVLLGVVVTLVIHFAFGVDVKAVVGMFSGATTNTPSLAAAQEAIRAASDGRASGGVAVAGYAVAYPLGIIGVILSMLLVRGLFGVSLRRETEELAAQQPAAVPMTINLEVRNPNLDNLPLGRVPTLENSSIVVSRVMQGGSLHVARPTTVLHLGDVLLAVGPRDELEALRLIVGSEAKVDLKSVPSAITTRRILVTKNPVLGKTIGELGLADRFGVNITRLRRGEVEFTPGAGTSLHFGDTVLAVGEDGAIKRVAEELGDSLRTLNHPQIIPIFVGLILGVIAGSIPITFPGIPAPVRLGLAGGPLVVAIILSRLGHFGPLIWHMPISANFILREFGIVLFLACVGYSAADKFVGAFVTQQGAFNPQGLYWMACGAAITLIPLLIMAVIARVVMRMNYLTLCGMLAGSMTDPPALAFAGTMTGSDAPSLSYATVYPLVMLLRVICAQAMVLLLMR